MAVETEEILMNFVICDKIDDFRNSIDECGLIQDERYFDYKLLKAALEREHLDIARYLLNFGCRVRNPRKIYLEDTPLHLAIKLNKSDIIRKIIESGASIYDKNRNGLTPIYAGFKARSYRGVHDALDFYHSTQYCGFPILNPEYEDDVRHFHIVCVCSYLRFVEQYLRFGIDVNAPFSLDFAEVSGLNPMHYAIKKKNYNLLSLLLKYGANLNIKNLNGQTPLQIMYYSGLAGTEEIGQIFKDGNLSKFDDSVDCFGVSNFHLCCTINNPKMVQKFIDKQVNVNSAIDKYCSINPGFTPLHFAVDYNCDKVVELLLHNGADCNKADTRGTTPLHLACENIGYKKATIVEILLDHEACCAAVNEEGQTPLIIAFYKSFEKHKLRESIIDKFVSKLTGEVNFVDENGLSHFHIACTRGDSKLVNNFLKSGVEINSTVVSGLYEGYTALHFAVLCNQKDIVEILLKRNARVDVKTSKFELTPLHMACNDHMKYGMIHCSLYASRQIGYLTSIYKDLGLNVIKLLLLHGADANATDCLGQTPLFHLITQAVDFYHFTDNDFLNRYNSKKKEIIEILLSNKANINAYSNNRESIFHAISRKCCVRSNNELLKFLISNGANVNAINVDGLTPLHTAVQYSNSELVNMFLQHKANINAKSRNLITPLELAIDHHVHPDPRQKSILKSLLQYGADVEVTNNGKSMLQIAIENCKTYALEKLLNYGADINKEGLLDNFSLFTNNSETMGNSWDKRMSDIVEVFPIIFVHVQKLLALGRYVSENVQHFCINGRTSYESIITRAFLQKNFSVNLNNMFIKCTEELEKMKLIKIDKYTSLFSILIKSTHELSIKHVINPDFVNIIEDQNIHSNFPLYSSFLKMQYKDSIIRRNIVESANESLSFVVSIELPEACCDAILKYLSNKEIINLKKVANLENRFK